MTDDDRAALFSLPDDKRAMVEDMMRRHAGLTAAEVLQAFAQNWDVRPGGRAAAPPRHRMKHRAGDATHCRRTNGSTVTALGFGPHAMNRIAEPQ